MAWLYMDPDYLESGSVAHRALDGMVVQSYEKGLALYPFGVEFIGEYLLNELDKRTDNPKILSMYKGAVRVDKLKFVSSMDEFKELRRLEIEKTEADFRVLSWWLGRKSLKTVVEKIRGWDDGS
jgi:hypothetical protein